MRDAAPRRSFEVLKQCSFISPRTRASMCNGVLLVLSVALCAQLCRAYLPTRGRGANLLNVGGRVSSVPLTRLLPSFLPDDVEAGPGPEISVRGGDGAFTDPLVHEAQRGSKRDAWDSLAAVWAFTRPHTLIGSAISISSLFAYATPAPLLWTPAFFRALGHAALPACAMNVYITGLNQVTDVAIDKINKPYLPLASGKLSMQGGVAIVATSLLLSLSCAIRADWPLRFVLLGSGLLGTLYSLPPFRLKRFPLLAALCITVVRGSLVNLGFLLQARSVLGGGVPPSLLAATWAYPQAQAITLFFAIFGLVIAFMKDVPDIRGDKAHNIASFSVRRGAGSMFVVSWRLLFGLLAGTAALGARSLHISAAAARALSGGGLGLGLGLAPRAVAVAVMTLFAYDVQARARTVDSTAPADVFAYYMHVWNVFYGCYLLLPLTR